jgi:predicted nicotinamide N-methyase
MTAPRIHSTPPEAVKELSREKVLIEGHCFHIERPGGTDLLFDHPAVRAAYAADEYVPYWTEVWPSSRMLAKTILREPWETYPTPPGEKLHALEIACGLGVAGLAALARGLRVTFSDIDELAMEYAAANAKRNHFTDFRTEAIDLRSPPPGLQVGVLLAADLLYEPRLVDPLVEFIVAVLAPTGVALIADPDRISSRPFGYRCQQAGLHLEATFARAGEPGGERTKGTIYRIRKQLGYV